MQKETEDRERKRTYDDVAATISRENSVGDKRHRHTGNLFLMGGAEKERSRGVRDGDWEEDEAERKVGT
jgi:hypothetical protein